MSVPVLRRRPISFSHAEARARQALLLPLPGRPRMMTTRPLDPTSASIPTLSSSSQSALIGSSISDAISTESSLPKAFAGSKRSQAPPSSPSDSPLLSSGRSIPAYATLSVSASPPARPKPSIRVDSRANLSSSLGASGDKRRSKSAFEPSCRPSASRRRASFNSSHSPGAAWGGLNASESPGSASAATARLSTTQRPPLRAGEGVAGRARFPLPLPASLRPWGTHPGDRLELLVLRSPGLFLEATPGLSINPTTPLNVSSADSLCATSATPAWASAAVAVTPSEECEAIDARSSLEYTGLVPAAVEMVICGWVFRQSSATRASSIDTPTACPRSSAACRCTQKTHRSPSSGATQSRRHCISGSWISVMCGWEATVAWTGGNIERSKHTEGSSKKTPA
mmetsp:Transcript_8050/g.25087  ORF Transcript_8050/g.25087 Transcript_8050/m.25087 type:complete len:398 (-) Transcript_8050:3272-4465(-)|eukprot:scaffold308102_cov30-Tisochrysis_lutea.AAC.1